MDASWAWVAVIEDVMTSGATLSECARVLREEGGRLLSMRSCWYGRHGSTTTRERTLGRRDRLNRSRSRLVI